MFIKMWPNEDAETILNEPEFTYLLFKMFFLYI